MIRHLSFLLLSSLGVAAASAATPELKPGAVLRFAFPGLSPNMAEMFGGKPVPNVLVAELPANYSAERKFPIVIYIDGGNGGDYLSTKGLREALGPDDFIAVRLPLFKKEKIPSDPAGGRAILSKDFEIIRTNYRVMLEKLFAEVTNITPHSSALGGFSNGAHTTGVLLEGGDAFTLAHFDRFYFIEGGVRQLTAETLRRPELSKARLLVMLGDRGRGPEIMSKLGDFASAAKAAEVKLTNVMMRGYGHEWPLDYKKLLPLWLRGQPLPDIAPKPADLPSKPAEAVEAAEAPASTAQGEFKPGDSIAVPDSNVADRSQHFGWLEAMLVQANADKDLSQPIIQSL